MNDRVRAWFVRSPLCLLVIALASPSAVHAQLVDPETPVDAVAVQPRVEKAFETEDRVRVFIGLREGVAASSGSAQSVLNALGERFELAHRYHTIPWLAGVLTRDGLALLRQHPGVSAVQLDGTGTGGLAEALPATGVDMVQAVRGLSGKGITVAVLDSGATTTHPALQGAIVGEHCFTQGGCPPGFASEGESAEDDHNHGSNVTGIVASRGGGGVSKGYAPGASIVAVKVLNRQNAGQVSDWVAGFDWVADNLDMLKVRVINASLVSTAEYGSATDCDQSESALAAATKVLLDKGVTIAASSGNTGHTDTMTAPACNTGVIAVGATYDSDLGTQPENNQTYQALGGPSWPDCSDKTTNTKTLACFTSTAGARLDLLAPGTQMTSTGRGTGTSMFRGTSQASPGVAGLSALLLECNGALTPSMILDVLKKTGEPVMDPRTGMSYPLIRGMQAAEMACPTGMPGTAGPGAGAPAPAAGVTGGSPAAGGGGILAASGGNGGLGSAGTGLIPAAGSGALVPPPNRGPAGAPAAGGFAIAGVGAGSAGSLGTPAGVATPPAPAAASDDSGCSCSAPGAATSLAAHDSQRSTSLAAFGTLSLLGLAFRRQTRIARRKRNQPQPSNAVDAS